MQRDNQRKFLQQMILACVFTALTTVLTFFIKIPSHNGYIHLGDTIIYIAACLLPTPLAMVCGALGGLLADTFGGFIIYIIPTAIIKALLPFAFTCKSEKIICKRNLLALIPASLITIIGYYIAEVIIICFSSGDLLSYITTSYPWITAVYCLPGNAIQALGSAIAFIFIAPALDKIKIKDKI